VNAKLPRDSKGKPSERRGRASYLFWSICGVSLAFCALGLRSHLQQTHSEAETATAAVEPAESSPAELRKAEFSKPIPSPAQAVAPVAREPAPVDPAMGALAQGLWGLAGTNGLLMAEAAQSWRTNFQQLVQAGPGAVAALRAFLAQKQDSAFGAETARALGYGSARLAAFDALRQIGGPEAAAVLEQALGETASPKEIAALALELDQLAQGQYRDTALARSREVLAAVSTSQPANVDVAPLFEVLQHYGDASVVADLERASSQWKYYAVPALANLPNDAGLESLVKMADPTTGSGNQLIALEMLAQLAANNQVARGALDTLINNRQIPPNFWPYLSGPLAGEQYYPVDGVLTSYPTVQSWNDIKSTHIISGNQNFYQLPSEGSLTPDGINQRLKLINDLMAATSDPAAHQTLQQVQSTLQNRMTRLAAAAAAPGAIPGDAH
jgi:hypothetical protein